MGLSGPIRFSAADCQKDRKPLSLGLCRHSQWKMQHTRDDDLYSPSHRRPILPIGMAGCRRRVLPQKMSRFFCRSAPSSLRFQKLVQIEWAVYLSLGCCCRRSHPPTPSLKKGFRKQRGIISAHWVMSIRLAPPACRPFITK